MASSRGFAAAAFITGLVWIAILSFHSAALAVVTFTDINAGLVGTYYGDTIWGDYDGDGDLDLLVTGGSSASSPITRLYRNDGGGTFTFLSNLLPDLIFAAAAWGDYDNDGDLDLVLHGRESVDSVVHRVYRNDGAFGFHDIDAGLPEMLGGSTCWVDYDNDGDLDIFATGSRPDGPVDITRIFRNDGVNTFTEMAAGFPDLSGSFGAWGDYDNDGDMDLLFTGVDLLPFEKTISAQTHLYRNDGGTFTEIPTDFQACGYGYSAWGDYDNDGDLDVVIAGLDETEARLTIIYRNDGEALFTDISAGLVGANNCAVAWGDGDNDGDLDLLLTGSQAISDPITIFYRNDGGGSFVPTTNNLLQVGEGSVGWGDYDNDGDLDLVVAGRREGMLYSTIYSNYGASANTPPVAPTGLAATFADDRLVLSWLPASDAETPTAGLSYNLRVGTSSGGSQIMSAMVIPATGHRTIPALGNAQQCLSWSLDAQAEQYYWSVQSIDGAFAGSVFAAEHSFSIADVVVPESSERLRLHPSAPNPFHSEAVISYELAAAEPIRLAIYNASGRCVRVLLEETVSAGPHHLAWDGTDDQNRPVGSGFYFCRLETGGRSETRSIVRIE
ncbi:MAG: VCBS repeat-containing protein [Candidatus Eisenbacteria bacterium]|uniref:VCBS repeat-containing protein n=1 Tax=Eiseniibacteriota bacterium TaxID=2212470 RepID=A0A948RTM6_UNCEI|nr:VCBS repeat-containing protein [Candidatus Eisenbacteria bacterium]MBU1951045.1 VCBS repeat-containing protein [Candidatus Eisenbacteria bacterium]MBU2689776.1 VCBS repeat-containing protein [Candidatus Eisenbacteria bacterium]